MSANHKANKLFCGRISIKGIGSALLLLVATVLSVFASTVRTEAAVNNNLNFQARLQSAAGAIVADGYYNVQFKLYDGGTAGGPAGAGAANAGTNLWTETYYDSNGSTAGNDNRVRVKNGYVSVNLGSQTAFPSTIDWSQELWLTMNIGGTAQVASPTWDGEMNPRLKLTGVPYAFKANSANQLQTVNGSYNSTLTLAGPTVGNQSFVIPDQGAAGTYNLLTTASANAGYIQNGTSLQTANFNISGNGQFGGYVSATGGFQANGQTGLSSLNCGSGGQLIQNAVVTGGIVTSGTCVAASSVAGVTTVGTFSASSIANGASISGNTITLGVADINNPGMVSTVAQTFLGAKTFNSGVTIAANQGLTMTSGTGTFTQGFSATSGSANTLTLSNTSGTQTNGVLINRNGTGGTTTNGVNVTNTLGTLTNGLQLTQSGGTFTNGINFTGTFTNLINSTNFSVTNAGALTAASTVRSNSGFNVNGTAGVSIASCGAGSFIQNATVVGGLVTAGSCAAATNGVTTVGTFSASSIANGASISGNTITLGVADINNPGMVSTVAQTFLGAKTFNGGVIVAAGQNLTMNSGTGTFSQTFTATTGSAATVTSANATGTNSSILSLDRNAAGGTTTNGLSIANTSGTLTNGIQFTGTMTNLINATNFTVTNAGALTAASTIRSNTGFNVNGTAGASIASCGAGNFLQNATVVGGIVTAGSCAAATNGVTTVGTFNTAGVANGASISGNTITFGAATASNPGMVSTGAQTLAGSKTFTGDNTLFKPGTNSTTAFQIQPASSTTPVFNVDTTNGLVGIGTDAPLYKLDILAGSNDGLRIQTPDDSKWGFMLNNLTYGTTSSTGLGFWQGNDGIAHIDNSDVRSLTIGTNGNVGIGANLNYKFDVDGQINATSGYRFNGTAGSTTTCSGGNFLQNAVIQGGIITGGTCVAGAAGGVTTVGAISATSDANGATITGSTINLTAADGANGGVVTNTTQTFGGNKTFNGTVTAANFTTAGTLTGAALNITGATTYNGNMTIGDTSSDRLTVNSQLLGGSPLVFQGATDNSFSTTLSLVDPTANRTITLPNASGTVAVSASGPLALNSTTGNLTLGTVGIANGGTGTTSFTTNGLVYSNGSNLTSTAAGTTGQCLIGSTGAAPTWGACGTASTMQDVYNSSGTTNPQIQLSSTNGGLKLRDASTTVGNLLQLQNSAGTVTYFAVTAGGVSLQNSSGTTAMDFNNSTGRLRIYNPSDVSKYADIYYDNAAGEAVFAANSGNTRIGNGSGNIILTTTNASDVASYTHTGTLSGASSANDFTVTQNLVAGSNALTGSVLRVEQLSSGTNITSSVLYLNTTSSTATLLTASLSGAEKFKVTSAGSVVIADNQTISTVSGNLGLTAGGANSVIVKTGTNNAAAFQVQNTSNNAVLSVDTSGAATLFGKASSVLGKLTLYNASNANTVSIQSGVTSTSYALTLPTAAPTIGQCLKGGASTATSLEWGACGATSTSKTVTIVPEYPGAVMSALSGSGNYNGTLTSDFDDTNNHNYYSWKSAQATLQDYDIVVRTPIPNTYASSFGNLSVWLYTDSTVTTNNDVTVSVRKTSGGTTTSCGTANTSILATSASTWQQRSISVGACTFASDDILMLSFRMKSRNNLGVAIGEITYTYNN